MIAGRLYDALRFLAQIVLPLVGTVYFLVAGADVVVGVILVAVFVLGALLWLSQRAYAKHVGQGDLIVEEQDGSMGLRLALDRTPEELVGMREVRFEVKRTREQEPSPA